MNSSIATTTNTGAEGKPVVKNHIMLVDDDSATLLTGKLTLENNGYSVDIASNGLDAVKLAKENDYAAIVLDAKMPVLDGFSACKRIRKLQNHKTTLIVMATGMSDDEAIENAFNKGVSDYIVKPVNFRVLSKKLSLIKSDNDNSEQDTRENELANSFKSSFDFSVELSVKGKLDIKNTQGFPKYILDFFKTYDTLKKLSQFQNGKIILDASALNNHKAPFLSKSFILESKELSKTCRLELTLFKQSKEKLLLLIKDRTEQLKSELKLYEMLNFDADTSLPNKNSFINKVSNLDSSNCTNLAKVGLAYFRLSNLQKHSSTYGHEVSNLLVKHAHSRIQNTFNDYNVNVHLAVFSSGDLCLLAEDCDLKTFRTALEVARRNLITPYSVASNRILVGVSVSASHGEQNNKTVSSQLNDCIAIINGSNLKPEQVNFHSSSMNDRNSRQSKVANLLYRDLERGVLELHFQPKFRCKSLKLCGMEALLRWNSYELGFVSPGEFIPAAETAQIMKKVSRFVIERSFEQLAQWKLQKVNLVPLSLNLDADSLADQSTISVIERNLEKHAIDASLIEVEITENMMIDAQSQVIQNLLHLQSLGIKISMDDFGTGYSSFSYLRDLPIDTLKIDQSFVRDIHQDKKATAIAKSIIEVGHQLNLHVIAEGVENKKQLELLAELNCDSIQGFYTGKPVAAVDFQSHFNVH